MSSNGPLIGDHTAVGKIMNPTRTILREITPDSWDKYTDILTPSILDPGGVLRDTAELFAVDPGEPPALDAGPNAENSSGRLNAAAAAQRKARGRASNILSGSSGTSGEPTTAKRQLLGV